MNVSHSVPLRCNPSEILNKCPVTKVVWQSPKLGLCYSEGEVAYVGQGVSLACLWENLEVKLLLGVLGLQGKTKSQREPLPSFLAGSGL